jgi:hypothetical protein
MMKHALILSLAGVTLACGAASAADEPAKPSSCAFVRSIDSWKPIDAESAYIYTSPRRKYKVTFIGPCRELKWAIFARLEARPSSAVCLSVGDTLVFGRGSLFPGRRFEFEERCTISSIEAMPFGESEQPPSKPAEQPPAP